MNNKILAKGDMTELFSIEYLSPNEIEISFRKIKENKVVTEIRKFKKSCRNGSRFEFVAEHDSYSFSLLDTKITDVKHEGNHKLETFP